MDRRTLLKGTATAALTVGMAPLGALRAFAQEGLTFTVVPQATLASVDPVWTTASVTSIFGNSVYDTLYGYDSDYSPQPQLAEGHTVSDDLLTWNITLRDGIKFHDGSPVKAEDCVASITRWAARDTLGSTLAEVTEELTAPDDKTIVFRLSRPFQLLPFALAKNSGNMCCIMPKALAETDPAEQVTEVNGCGPFVFVEDEWVSGSTVVFEKSPSYNPRKEPLEYTSGGKAPGFDRMVWKTISDGSTAVAALQSGEVDCLERVPSDYLPILKGNPDITLVRRTMWAFAVMRFNQLQPPFDNEAIRRAVLSAVDQKAFMTAMFGAENDEYWKANVGVFVPDTPMASDAGLDVMGGNDNIEAARQAIVDAGYNGEPVVVMDTTSIDWIHAAALLSADLLTRLGMNVDVQTMDWGTLVQRRAVKGSIDEGGWNVFCTGISGANNLNPAGHLGLRSNGEDAWFGWPDNPDLEQLRENWLFAEGEAEQQAIARKVQEVAMQRVPYVPLGAYTSASAIRNEWTGLISEEPYYYGVKPA